MPRIIGIGPATLSQRPATSSPAPRRSARTIRAMARSLWTGSLSFGLVNVPVQLVTALRDRGVHFHQLHDADGVRISTVRVCPADGEQVPYDEVVRGYEVADGQYVTVTDEELESLAPERTRTIDIEEFVDLAEIEPLRLDHPYYLL